MHTHAHLPAARRDEIDDDPCPRCDVELAVSCTCDESCDGSCVPLTLPGPIRVNVLVGSQAWHDIRRTGVTASEIAGVLGIAPDTWTSPFNLYWQKKGLVTDGRDNESMVWGRDLEEVILRRFAREHPEFHVTPGALFRCGTDPRWMATPDGLAAEADDPIAVVQVKTAGSQEHWGEPGTDDIPPYYVAQVRWEMMVMGIDTAFVPVLFSGRTYKEYVVGQNAEDVALMVAEADQFMHRLATDDPPDLDWRTATTTALKQLHPSLDDTEVDVDQLWVNAYNAAAALEDEAKQRKRMAENEIRAQLGDAARGVVDGRKVVSRSIYDVKEHVRKASTTDRLYISKGKLP